MMHLINSIPLLIRIVIVIICGIALIYEYIKGRCNNNKAGKSIVLFLIICVPITLVLMVINQFPEKDIMLSESVNLSTIFLLVIPLGIVIIALINLIKGNLPEPQRTIIRNSLIGLVILAVFVVLFCL